MEKKIWKIAGSLAMAVFFCGLLSFSPAVFAEDEGASGCNGVSVDPEMSLEDQQVICGNAEQFPSTSCAAGGHGVCSAPKTNGILTDGNHCICIEEDLTLAATGDVPLV